MWLSRSILLLLSTSISQANVIRELSSGPLTVKNDTAAKDLPDKNNPEVLSNVSERLPHGPQYEVQWKCLGRDKIRVQFSLFSMSEPSNRENMTDSNSIYAHRLPTTAVTANHSLSSIHSLHYLLFTFRSYNPKNETVLPMEPLVFEGSRARQEKHFINALSVGGLDPKKKERYTFCIYYYQRNISIEWPDLSICQDVINDHTMYTHSQAHSKSDLVFISTQYSIIITILVVLQTLLSMHKRHIAHVVQQHLINKAHRFRSSFSSISLVRQSVSSADILTPHELDCRGENHQFSAGIVSSPIMLQSNASILSAVGTASSEENEPFIKLAANKNHVQFLLGEEEESDDTDEADGTQLDPKALADSGPYGDRSDAMQSIAHILDNDKPWCKYKRPSISVC